MIQFINKIDLKLLFFFALMQESVTVKRDACMQRGTNVCNEFGYPPSKMVPMKKSFIFLTRVSNNFLTLTTFVLTGPQDFLLLSLLLLLLLLLLL